jgi:phenylacetate-CoA ligase
VKETRRKQTLQAWQDFLNTSLEKKLNKILSEDPELAVLNLFHSTVKLVPGYRAFLEEQEIIPEAIKTFADFQNLPLLTKTNYLQSYPLNSLCRGGEVDNCDLIAVSSGSTGNPTFWPRALTDELEIATRFEQIFRDSFQAHTKSTLAVVCFTLGTWVGGIYTANCCRHLAAKGYSISVVTPGNNKAEIFRAIRELAPRFAQTVLLGYPPFLKDAIDSGIAEGIRWQDYRVKLVTAGEVFSEEWRDLVGDRLGCQNLCYDFASLYGTADAGVLGNETPLSICIRRFLSQNPAAARSLFGESRLPTLVQYDPFSRFFESEGGTLLFSGDNGVPLIRYHIADTGGILSYDRLIGFLQDWNFNPLSVLGNSRGVYPLPFVYVFGRNNFIVSYFGANIYPENIAIGLEQPQVRDWVTGKFVMEVKEDRGKNIYLAIAIELAPRIESSGDLEMAIARSIQTQLIRLNGEFANYVPREYQLPQISLKTLGDSEYFPLGVKHRYIRR